MKFTVYQIDHEKDKERVCFTNYEDTIAWAGKVDPAIYHKVWESEIDPCGYFNMDRLLEEVFWMLNAGEKPEGYTGRSLSVSDVIVTDIWAYFVDSIGFKRFPADGFPDVA